MMSMPSEARWSTAKSIASMTSLVMPAPSASSTLSDTMRAFEAMPRHDDVLDDRLPDCAMVPATCVPWP